MADLQLHPSSIEAMFNVDYLELLESSIASLRTNILSQILLVMSILEKDIEFSKDNQLSLFDGENNEHIIKKVFVKGTTVFVSIEPKQGEELVNINISDLDGTTDYDILFREDVRTTIAVFNLVRNTYLNYIIHQKK